jgi:hypothetical protein
VLLAATTFAAAGPQLASLPAWVWLAGGGAVLLTVAALIERRGPASPDLAPAQRLRAVWQRFD